VEILLGNAVLATVPLSAGIASYSIAGLPAGGYSVGAAYLGDATYSPSVSAPSAVTVISAATTTSLTSSASQVSFGNTATLTAQVTSAGGVPSGTVAFLDGSTQIGTATLSNGSAVINAGLAVGVHSITASYVATQNFAVSTSSPVSITVTSAVALTLSVLPAPLPYTISTIAGGAASNCAGATDGSGDGCPATQATLTSGTDLRGVAVDTFGNVYFTDATNKSVHEINAVTGILSTKAGAGTACSSKIDSYGDGCPASQTVLNAPRGVWADVANNVFIAGYNDSLVHEIQASSGKMSMVAGALTVSTGSGAGVVGTGADGAAATTSALSKPRGVWTDLNGNIYIADSGNDKVRVVYAAGLLPNVSTPVVGDIYTLVGTAAGGTGTAGSSGDKGIATSALLNTPQGGITDVNGNVFIADSSNGRIRVIYMAGTTVANLIATENPGTTAQVGFIYTIAGGGGFAASTTPQLATSVSLGTPQKLATDAGGNLYFGDSSKNEVFFVDIRSGYLRILAGGAASICSAHTDAMGDGCPATQATITSSTGAGGIGDALDYAGNLYLSDTGNLRIRKVSTNAVFGATVNGSPKGQTMDVHFIVGDTPVSAGAFGLPSGQADFAATPTLPCTLQVDTTTDCLVSLQFSPMVPGVRSAPLTITSTLGSVASIGLTGIGSGAGGAIDPATQLTIGSSLTPRGVGVDASESVYVSDSSSGSVLKYAAGSAAATTLANGFVTPSGLAVDGAGAVYVADPGAGQVKRIAPTGTISSIGSSLTTPVDVAVDLNGNIYIADSSQSSIIEVSSAFTAQSTIGSGFSSPSSVAVDSAFNVWVADPVAGKVTKITPAGVSTVVATGASTPTAVAVDAAGNLYVADAATLAVILVPATSGPATAIYSNLISPLAISADGIGNVYVADSGMTSVVELARTQGLITLPNTSTSLTATLSSIGNQPIIPAGSGFSQTDSTDFSLSGSGSTGCNFAAQIAAGAACTLTAAFTPQTAGNLTDIVTLTGNYSNVALANPQSLQLTLTGNNVVTNVSGSVKVVMGGFAYSIVKHVGTQTVTITNTSANAIAGPLQLVLSGLPSTVTAANNTGMFQGNPFWTSSVPSLAPGASVEVIVQFSYKAGTNFGTTPTVYSGVL
ncbi:MAG: Ig-like domain repeat protein, partial [Bryobacteraceae bacterium]